MCWLKSPIALGGVAGAFAIGFLAALFAAGFLRAGAFFFVAGLLAAFFRAGMTSSFGFDAEIPCRSEIMPQPGPAGKGVSLTCGRAGT